MFCASELVLGDTEGVGSSFYVLRSRTHFGRYRGRRVPFSCFVLWDSFSTLPRTSSPVLMFCAPVLIFDGAEGVRSRLHVLHFRTRFGRCRGRQVQFSCFALPDLFSTKPRASGPVFMFCAPRLIFSSTEGVGSCFQVLHSQTLFRRYRVHLVLFLCFALSNSFSAIPWAPVPVFIFCALGPVFAGTEGVKSSFQVLRSHTHSGLYRTFFGWYLGRRVQFSCFVLLDSFLT
jgi:hypothetical protein